MKNHLFLALASIVVVGCNASQPPIPSPEVTASPTAPAIQPTTGPAPKIGTLTLDEIDLRGCGMALYEEGANPSQGGIYLFSGLVEPSAPAQPGGSMRMKLDGEIVKFTRTATSGEEIPGGQFTLQTFTSEAGNTTATVETAPAIAGSDPEANQIPEATITVIRDGQESTVEAVGDAGC